MTKHVIVRGRVQGVGFRYAVARAARTQGVNGWVRNLPDGTLEAVFEGEPAAVGSLLRFCGTGPRGASVAEVEVADREPVGAASFDVR